MRSVLPSAAAAICLPALAWAADPVVLTLKDHRFTPAEITAPAGERFKIQLTNQDDTPAELESSGMRIEKVVVPGGTITVTAGPLKPGAYAFFDEYHPDEAKGSLTVPEAQAAAEKKE